jgi:hypothetical protein
MCSLFAGKADFGSDMRSMILLEFMKHTAAPDAVTSSVTRRPKVQDSGYAPNSGRECTSSPGLLARDDISCLMQAAAILCNAQHNTLMLVHMTSFVKSRAHDAKVNGTRLK